MTANIRRIKVRVRKNGMCAPDCPMRLHLGCPATCFLSITRWRAQRSPRRAHEAIGVQPGPFCPAAGKLKEIVIHA